MNASTLEHGLLIHLQLKTELARCEVEYWPGVFRSTLRLRSLIEAMERETGVTLTICGKPKRDKNHE